MTKNSRRLPNGSAGKRAANGHTKAKARSTATASTAKRQRSSATGTPAKKTPAKKTAARGIDASGGGPKTNQRATKRLARTRSAAQDNVLSTLPEAMTGRASPAKAADGDEPVFAYIRSLPQPQRGVAERVDALAAKTLSNLKRSVKWGMAWYGVGDGWCFACGGFARHVKLTFGRGTALKPVPPVVPVGMGKDSRGVELESADDLDEAQVASWMKQATAIPGFGAKKR